MSVPSIPKASIDELRSTFLNNYSMRGLDSEFFKYYIAIPFKKNFELL